MDLDEVDALHLVVLQLQALPPQVCLEDFALAPMLLQLHLAIVSQDEVHAAVAIVEASISLHVRTAIRR